MESEEDDNIDDEENIRTPKRNNSNHTSLNLSSMVWNQGNTPTSSSLLRDNIPIINVHSNPNEDGFNTPPPPPPAAARRSSIHHPTAIHSKNGNNNNNVQKPIVNPFEAALTERLHLPLINSPNLFRLPSSPPLSSTKFEWTIEEVSSLIPVNVEAHETQFISTIDPEVEAKAQAAIHSYFKDTLEVPSPIVCQLRSQKIILKDDDDDYDDYGVDLINRPNKYKKKIINDQENISRGTQTELKIPPLLPDVTMKSILKHFNCTTNDTNNTEIRTPKSKQHVDNVMHHSTAFGFLSPISQLATTSKLKSNQFSTCNPPTTVVAAASPPSSPSSQPINILKEQPSLSQTKDTIMPFSSSVIVRSTPEKKRYRLDSIDSPVVSSNLNDDESMRSISPTNKNHHYSTPTTTTTTSTTMDVSLLNSNQYKRSCENLTPLRSSAKREMTRKNLKLSFHEPHDDNFYKTHYQDDCKATRRTTDRMSNFIMSTTKEEYCQTEITVGTNELIDDLSELLSEYTRFRKDPNQNDNYNGSDRSPSQLIDHDARDESLRRNLFDIIYNANCGNATNVATASTTTGATTLCSTDNNGIMATNMNKSDLSIIDDIKLIGLSPLPPSPKFMKGSTRGRYFGTPPNLMNKSLNTSFSPILNEQMVSVESIENDQFKSTTISLYENQSDTTDLSSKAQQQQQQQQEQQMIDTTTTNNLIHMDYGENLINIQMNGSDLDQLLSTSPLSPNMMDISRPQSSITSTSTNSTLNNNDQKTPTNRRPMNRRNLSNLFTLEHSEMDQF